MAGAGSPLPKGRRSATTLEAIRVLGFKRLSAQSVVVSWG